MHTSNAKNALNFNQTIYENCEKDRKNKNPVNTYGKNPFKIIKVMRNIGLCIFIYRFYAELSTSNYEKMARRYFFGGSTSNLCIHLKSFANKKKR